jgi:hypothetical protein
MSEQPMQEMMTVLPNAFGHNERRVRIQVAENLHPHLLGINETMLLLLVEGMSAHGRPALSRQGLGDDTLHFGLFRPAFLIGGQAKIAIGHEVELLGF